MQPINSYFRALPRKGSKPAGKRHTSPGATLRGAAVPTAIEAVGPAAAAVAPAAGEAPAPLPHPGSSEQVQHQFTRKRKRPSGGTAAAAAAAAHLATPSPASAASSPADGAVMQAGVAATAAAAAAGAAEQGAGTKPAPLALQPQQHQQPQQQRPLTQMYLDVGQRNFHSYRCPTCGMLYARGTDADDRLHAAFHASATEGPRYQGWQGEKVVQVDGSRGRVLLFGSADQQQGRGRKQLQDLSAFLEEQMGLPQGWLLRVPLTLLLYVSPARRIQALVAVEAVREAFPVKPILPPCAVLNMRSCGSAAVPAASGSRGDGGQGVAAAEEGEAAAAGEVPAAAAVAQVVQTPGRSLLSVTLSSGAGAATADCGGGGIGTSDRASGAPAAGEGVQAEPVPAAGAQLGQGQGAAVACAAQQARQQQQQAQQQARLSPPQAQQAQQQVQQQARPSPPPPQQQQQQQAQPQQQQARAQQQAPPQAQQAQQRAHQAQTQPQQQGQQQAQPQQPQQQVALASAAPPPLELDHSRRVRAVCGVRLMWVSVEARHRGLATRLLDCCRCQTMPGYVVPRHELAFSSPTDDGRGFIEAYTGTRRFLVYE